MNCSASLPFRNGSCDAYFAPAHGQYSLIRDADDEKFLPEYQVEHCAHYCSKYVDADLFTSSPSNTTVGCSCYKNNCQQVDSNGDGQYLYKLEDCTRSCNPYLSRPSDAYNTKNASVI